MKLLTAPTKPAPPPAPSVIGALKNIGAGLYQRTAKFAGYRAASPTATTGIGSRIGTNPNSTWANMQRVGMQFTAENVSKNSAIAWAYLASRQNYCSSQMTYIPATGDSGLDKEITAYLHGYDGCGGKLATMGVDCSLQDAFMRTADIETPVRGDAGLIIHRDGEEIRLIEFSADQLGEIYQFTMPRACGLTRNADGYLCETSGSDTVYLAGRYFQGCDCVAYKVYQRTNAWYGSPVLYPASDVIYFRDPASYRGVRGVTFFANAIQHMAKGEDLLQAALSAAQRQARTYGRVFNNSGESDEASYETSNAGNITFFEKVPGSPVEEFYYVGDQAEFAAPNTPSAEVISGVETADERVAIALRLNYAFLISATKVGGAPSRLEVEKADKEFQRIQNTIHRPRLRRIVDIVLMDAVRRGDIVPPRGMTGEQFKRGRWMLPISPSVDAFYDATENIKMMRAGLESAEDIIAETNRNADDVLMKSKRWAVKCAQTVEDANKELVEKGYKPSVTIADIAQVSDNPQQAAAAEAVTQGKPAAGGVETDPKKQAVAQLAEWDESKHSRAEDGEFGADAASAKADKHSMSKITGGDEHHHKLGAAYHREAAAKHRTESLRNEGSFSSESHKAQAENHEKFAEMHDAQAKKATAALAEFDESKHKRGQPGNAGEFRPGGGGAKKAPHEPAAKTGEKTDAVEKSGATLTPTKERAWNGKTVETKAKLSKLETGAIGEKAVTQWLKDQGFDDARPYDTSRNNAPIDLLQDHELYEVKTGLVSNGDTAQHWRATIGQPSPAETKWLKTASKEEKKAFNLAKSHAIEQRKADELTGYSKRTGRKAKGKMICTHLNPDTKTIDIYEFDGFKLRIPWNSPDLKSAYRGSYKYE